MSNFFTYLQLFSSFLYGILLCLISITVLFGESNDTYPSLNFSLSGKLFFGKQKNWYTKAGFSFRQNITESGNNSSYGPIIALGRNLKIKNKNKIKLELNANYDSYHGLISGVKLGFRF